MSRVETGPLKFGDDWTGVFIRGDNALSWASYLTVMNDLMGDDFLYKGVIQNMIHTLSSCAEHKEMVEVQHIVNFVHSIEKK